MACTNCGGCEGKVGLTIPPDYVPFVALHDIPMVEERGEMKVIFPAPCRWYDSENKRCLHYEQRPKICREYFCDKAKEKPMEITKDALMERRRSLEADLIAINGAIQDCDYWLEQIESEGVAAEAVAPDLIDIIED